MTVIAVPADVHVHELIKWGAHGGVFRPDLPAGAFGMVLGLDGEPAGISFTCPHGCATVSTIPIRPGVSGACWDWNGDRDKPTLSPSIRRRRDVAHECGFHGFLQAGVWEICGDSACSGKPPLKFMEDSDNDPAPASPANAGGAEGGSLPGAKENAPMSTDTGASLGAPTETVGQHIGRLFGLLFAAHVSGQPISSDDLNAADAAITALKTADDAQFAALGGEITVLQQGEALLEGEVLDFASKADLSNLADRVAAVESDLQSVSNALDALDAYLTPVDPAAPGAPTAILSTNPAHSTDPAAPAAIITTASDGTILSTPVMAQPDPSTISVSVDPTTGVPTVSPVQTDGVVPVLGVTAPAPDGTPAPADPAHIDAPTSTIVTVEAQ